MNEYTKIARYYDILMTAGYYNYDVIAASLQRHIGARDRVLEIGVGSGLVAEQLRHHRPRCRFTGVDHTEAMLAIAHDRIGEWCGLVQADVTTMALRQTFDVIFSCGGVWYLIDAGAEWQLCSHIPDEVQEHAAFLNVLSHLRPGGLLLLSIQGVHEDYETILPGEVLYRQHINWCGDLFQKEYTFEGPQGRVVQHTTYRIRHQPEMDAFLRQHRLVALPESDDSSFHVFRHDPRTAPAQNHPL